MDIDRCFAAMEACLAQAKQRMHEEGLQQRVPGGDRVGDDRFTVGEFAERLDCHEDVIRRAIRAGELPAAVLPGPGGKPSYRLTLPDCIGWLKTRGADPGTIGLFERVAARRAGGATVTVLDDNGRT
jgi:excisionase family DNA binding protein